MHVTITYIHRIYILKHSLQLLVMGTALSFSLFQELTPVAYQSTAEAGKKSRGCLSVLDIMIFFKLAKQARITGELRTTCSNYLVGW